MDARAVLLAVALTACGGSQHRVAAPPSAATCTTTQPLPAPKELVGGAVANGNGELWVVGLPPGGVIEIDPKNVAEDGSLYAKLGWFRAHRGDLHISGERVDAPAPPLRAESTPNAPDNGFEASGLTFSSQGCWKVTGRIGDGRPLSFVVFVVKR